MALTNPDKLVNVQELAYFEGKIGRKYATIEDMAVATIQECAEAADEITFTAAAN